MFHEPEQVAAEEQAALSSRKVDLHPGICPATTEVQMTLDIQDAVAFDRAVAATAETLKASARDDLDVRRAKAVAARNAPSTFAQAPPTAAPRPTAGAPAGPRAARPSTALWLHLDESSLLDLDTFPAAVHLDGLGTVSSDLLAAWRVGSTVVVRSVLDLHRPDAVDGHDPPEQMADLVRLRDRHCVFPGCRRRSRLCDLDHIDAYTPIDRGGAPGQTNPANLAPLCRRHHRAKTHSHWHYRRLPDGSYRWTSPLGRTYPSPRR